MKYEIYLGLLITTSICHAEETGFPKIDIRRTPADYSFLQTKLSSASFVFDETKRDPFQMDFRSCDLSSYDLSRNSGLINSSFNTKTIFPKNLPSNFIPIKILDLGKNPGLGIRKLHADGITGKSVGIAILDQALLIDHVEYADRLRVYEEIHCMDHEASMHGPAVASIAAGKTVGVASGADLYFIGMTAGEFDNGNFTHDLGYVAQGIDRVLEINKQLPRARRIRVISISLAMIKNWKNYDRAMRAITDAEKAGLLVLTVENDKFPYDGLGRPPMSDPELADSYSGGMMFSRNHQGALPDTLQIPMDSRTFADPTGPYEYSFSRIGGQSWIVPWMAGLYALACQVRPDITPELFWKTALDTANAVDFKRDGKDYRLAKVVNPVALIGRLKSNR